MRRKQPDEPVHIFDRVSQLERRRELEQLELFGLEQLLELQHGLVELELVQRQQRGRGRRRGRLFELVLLELVLVGRRSQRATAKRSRAMRA